MTNRPVRGKDSELRNHFPQNYTVRQVTYSGGGGGGDASTLNGQPGSFYLNRANHTGANNADTLQGQAGAHYLNRTNHTGTQGINSTTTGTLADNRLTSNVMLFSTAMYSGTDPDEVNFPISHHICVQLTNGHARNSNIVPRLNQTLTIGGLLVAYNETGVGALLAGVWRFRCLSGLDQGPPVVAFALSQRVS